MIHSMQNKLLRNIMSIPGRLKRMHLRKQRKREKLARKRKLEEQGKTVKGGEEREIYTGEVEGVIEGMITAITWMIIMMNYEKETGNGSALNILKQQKLIAMPRVR